MKVLLITEWFPPVKGAAAKRTQMIAQAFKDNGHKVTVLTSFPSYPHGILPKKYHWKLWAKEKQNGLDIIRLWEFPTANSGTLTRIIRELTFFVTSALAAIILPVHDAVIVSSPSFLSGLSGLCGTRENAKFYFDVRDLWPDSLESMGVLKPGFLLDMLEKLGRLYYNRAEKILVATPSLKKRIFLKGVNLNKIEVLLNAAYTDLFRPQSAQRPADFKAKDYVVTFIGNHSRMYDLENVIKAAILLENKPNIKFLFIGEGESKAELKETTAKLKLKNIVFYDEQPKEEIASILAWSNIGLISLANTKIAQETLPSKMSEYLASGLPVLAAISGDTKKIIEDNNVGLIYEAGNSRDLIAKILKLHRQKNLTETMSKNARKLALKMFSRKAFEKKVLQVLN